MLLVGMIKTWWEGSNAAPPQAMPPMLPGRRRLPCKLGGVNTPSERSLPTSSAHHFLSSSVAPHTLAGVNFACGERACGAMGNGCVGEETSPGVSEAGTG